MSRLHELIREANDIEGIRDLIRARENLNGQNIAGLTPLHATILRSERTPQMTNDLLVVARELIHYGANVNLADFRGCTPLHVATMCREYRMMEILLQAKAEVDKQDHVGWAPLHKASRVIIIDRVEGPFVYEPEISVVRLLLRYKADINILNDNDQTPLMIAVIEDCFNVVSELLQQNASVNLEDSFKNTAAHYALDVSEWNLDIVFELARYGCKFGIENIDRKTPMRCFFERLSLNPPVVELEKAKHVIKLLMIAGCKFKEFEDDILEEISRRNRRCHLNRFADICQKEISKMGRDKLAEDYSVHYIAVRGALSIASEDDHIPIEVYDSVLQKLMKGKYFAYSDVIATGICNPYMANKYAETCCNIESGVKIFNIDALYLISFYLSHLDMINMMIACCRPMKRPSFLSRFARLTRRSNS